MSVGATRRYSALIGATRRYSALLGGARLARAFDPQTDQRVAGDQALRWGIAGG